MATGEQPPKKRRFQEAQQKPPPLSQPQPQPQPPPSQTLAPPKSVGAEQSLHQEEILKKRRHRDEIRSVYDSYKRIKFCLSKKDSALTAELEQAYLSLITASRGCTSVQRIVADLIPRYASKCPTALEAAVKVVINMYKWSMGTINKGDGDDGLAFETAKSCILGLSDICCTASSVTPTSSVIRGICAAVFQNVLAFFISALEGKDIFLIVGKETLRIQDSSDIFCELKQKYSDENESSSLKLLKLCALSLLWILFRYPKKLLAAWFDLFKSSGSEGVLKGQFFLSQITSRIGNDSGYPLGRISDESKPCTGDGESSTRAAEVNSEQLASDGNYASGDASTVSNSCLLELVLSKNPSLQSWMFSKYKKFCKISSFKGLSDIESSLEDVFRSFGERMDVDGHQMDSDEEDSDSSRLIERAYMMPRFSNQHETCSEPFGKDSKLRPNDGSYGDGYSDRVSGQHLKPRTSVTPLETNSSGSNQDSGGARSTSCESRERGDMSHGRSSVPRELMNHQVLSPVTRSPLDFRSNSFDGRKHANLEKNRDATDFGSPLLRSSSGGVNSFESPKCHLVSPHSSTTQIIWYSDGDIGAMDIVSASKQLWLGFSGSDASEAHLRYQLERFGVIEQFIFFPIKGFALVEYRNMLDAIKAREYIRGHFPWHVKFMDIGLGTRSAMNGVAVGSSCHVYVGHVVSQWARDEILHESRKVLYKGPYMITDLSNEGALLMEFDTPEEAAAVMAHLRQLRKERTNYRPSHGAGQTNAVTSQIDGARSVPTPIHVDIRGNHLVNMSTSHAAAPFSVNHESHPMELVSPRVRNGSHGHSVNVQSGYSFQSNTGFHGSMEMLESAPQKMEKNSAVGSLQGGSHVASHSEQKWMYGTPGMELHSAPGSSPCISVPTQRPSVPPPPQINSSPFVRPAYLPPNSPWDPRGVNPLNPISPGVMPNNFHGNAVVPPFVPASVTPLAQVQGAPVQQFDQMFSVPIAPPPVSSLPPPLPEMPPPMPPSPPPLPESQPPFVPPPPQSPPPAPLPVPESSGVESSGQCVQYQWQGTLCKSGVHYCTVYAYRVDSDICKYSDASSEPVEWPAQLDMTKRTDFHHVKSTFTSTPPHKREVCRLIPASEGDQKGFQEFVSYLKQRECSGVIKIPPMKSLWARLLFILPHSNETCSMLSIPPSDPDCLIALVLPKETNFDWV